MGERLLLKQCLAGMITPTMLECLSIHALVGVCAATRPAEGSGLTGGGPKRPATNGADGGFDAWAFGDSGSAGSALLVRFEISIVKVSRMR